MKNAAASPPLDTERIRPSFIAYANVKSVNGELKATALA